METYWWWKAAIITATMTFSLVGCRENKVVIDLKFGIVKGYSEYVSFIEKPTPSLKRGRCDAQAVIKIDFSGAFDRVRFKLQYDKPRLWTLDVSDSRLGDGYGGANGTTSNMAELQIYNRQMRVYGNDLPGHLDAAIDGGLLLKIVDDVIRVNDVITIEVSDERVEWRSRADKHYIESKFLYTLSGQNTTYGEKDYDIYAGFNRVVAGNFRSGSGLCRVTISLFEDELVDRCRLGSHHCHKDALCHNTRRSFRCECKPGFYGNGKICLDDNECQYSNGGCVHFCTNYQGNYTCGCLDGFQLDVDGHNCIDVDECLVNKAGCDHQCVNTLGTYLCKCNEGYSLAPDGKRCIVGLNGCQKQYGCAHSCVNTLSGIKCICRKGYKLHSNGKDCIPTCAVGNGGCQHQCTDTPEGPQCNCHEKYTLKEDGKHCIATCFVNNGGCSKRCEDTADGPKCSCPPGFILHQDKKTCLDIDECSHSNGGCSHGCVNVHGSYECICPKGYRVQEDLKTCADIDECSQNNTCDHGCINYPGSFECLCHSGFELYGVTHCADKNECSVNNGGCAEICINTYGGYKCDCRQGYRLHNNNKDCIAAKRCQDLRTPAKTRMSCYTRGLRRTCTVRCQGNTMFTTGVGNSVEVECGPDTGYLWTHEVNGTVLPSCSSEVVAPGYKRRLLLWFTAFHCTKVRKKSLAEWKRQLEPLLVEVRRNMTRSDLKLDFINIACNAKKKRKLRAVARRRGQSLVAAELELNVPSPGISDKCDLVCAKKKGYRIIKHKTKFIKNLVIRKGLDIRYDGEKYEVVKDIIKARKIQHICAPGHILIKDICVSCSVGTYHDRKRGICVPCPPGTYMDREGAVACKRCPHGIYGVGTPGAQHATACTLQCDPGTYSQSGIKPCRSCRYGTYQPSYGRTQCLSCGPGITTDRQGATSFSNCLVKVKCKPGEFYNKQTKECNVCPKDTYQPSAGQDYCIDCPGHTKTDYTGATNSSQCKDVRCGGSRGEHQGYIQSPNWPGSYPNNVKCTWTIKPEKGRRILVIIPEIFLASQDKCGDVLIMRKSKSPYSLLTYETCESTETPIAFTARSRKLWIQFKTDGNNSNKGFSIPYVTYNEEYQDLIDDIVRDGRLYSSYQHQEVLKDKRLLSALLEVIAHPYSYFKYAQISHNMFPATFIKLLRNKVMRFFEISYE